MPADDAVNVFLPLGTVQVGAVQVGTVQGLSVPPLAVTDGSADPTWVELPYSGRFLYSRQRMLRLPFDAATAEQAHRWLRFERRRRILWIPGAVVLMVAGLIMSFVVTADRADSVGLVLYAAGLLVSLSSAYAERKLTVAQSPELIGRLGVYLPAVSAVVAAEWVQRNAGVQVVRERPRWRRYSSLFYRWASGSCAVAAVGVWWFGLRDGEFGSTTSLLLVALLGGAVVSAFKALPAGFVRFDNASDQ